MVELDADTAYELGLHALLSGFPDAVKAARKRQRFAKRPQ